MTNRELQILPAVEDDGTPSRRSLNENVKEATNPTETCFLYDERGQTLQDYALGISIFLVTVFLVVTMVIPSMLAPFEDDSASDSEAQADRVANRIIHNTSVEGRLNALNVTKMEQIVDDDIDQLRDRYRLPNTSWVNVSVENLDGSSIVRNLNTMRSPGATESATSSRIVTLSDGSCQPACRLVVRVW